MSEYTFIGDKISLPAIRDYIISHKINEGDTIVVSPTDFSGIIDEIKASGEGFPDIPLTLLGVIITKDDGVPIGKIQIVKNEKPYL